MQLGKLGVSQADQALAGKTRAKPHQSHQWHSGGKENHPPIIPAPPLIVEDDHGRFRLGLYDDASGFETRKFACDVWLHRQTRHSNRWARQ
jgi:hypothetical protein